MKFKGAWLGICVCAGIAPALLDCVGDEPADSSTDGGSTSDASSGDAASGGDSSSGDAGTDSGPSCIPPTSATPGALDDSFGSSFKSLTNNFTPWGFTIDSSGRSYVVGQAFQCVSGSSGNDYAVVRFLPNGDVDSSFNPSNKPKCYDFGTGGELAQAVAVDRDGKIVIGGLGGTGPSSYVAGVLRIDDTGAVDTSFAAGTSGLLHGVYAGAGFGVDQGKFISVNGIGFFGDKIVLAGSDDNNSGNRTTAFVVRMNHDGTLDSGFGTGGIYSDGTNAGGFSNVAVSSDGKVAAVGGFGAQIQANFLVERLTSAGVLDATFGTGGIWAPGVLAGGSQDISHNIELLPNGSYVVSGAVQTDGITGTAAVAMIDATGHPVSTFGTGGVFVAPAGVLCQPDTQDSPIALLCGGDFFYVGKQKGADGGIQGDVDIMHVTAGGTLDNAFGTSGVGRANQTTVVNVVAVAEDPTTQKPIAIVTNLANQVGIFRFDP